MGVPQRGLVLGQGYRVSPWGQQPQCPFGGFGPWLLTQQHGARWPKGYATKAKPSL